MPEASFRLAYDEAVRALRAQADEHGSLRTRAGTILATSLVVTSFFGGQAITADANGTLAKSHSLAWLAVIALLFAGTFSLGVLFPTDLRFASNIGEVVELIENASVTREPHRELSLSLAHQLELNRRRMDVMLWMFRASAVAVLAETVLWIAYLAP
jgi:hypothetical protein